MRKLFIALSKKSKVLRLIMRKGLFLYQRARYMFYYLTQEVDDHLVIFESFNGRSYSDSSKAIYLEMLNDEKYKDYKFVWCFLDAKAHEYLCNERTKVISCKGSAYYKYYSQCKYVFTCSKLPNFIKFKKNQVYVQCWHGTPLKRLGFDINVDGENAMYSVKEWQDSYMKDAERYTYMVSPSRFCTEKFISAFNLKSINKDKCILEKGYPRNDYLYSYNDSDVERIKESIGVPKDKKIILYAPTWRDNQHDSKVGYTYKNTLDLGKLKAELGDEYVILFRTHYLVANKLNLEEYKPFTFNVSDYEDVNELYVISDILITDYSSVFFDYANLKRPILFYMYDLDEYKGEMRDFYINLEELPGPIVEEENVLIEEIKGIEENFKKYKEKYSEFNDKYNYLDSKECSKRVLDVIFNDKQ